MASLTQCHHVAEDVRSARGDAMDLPVTTQHRSAPSRVTAGVHGAFAPTPGPLVHIIPQRHWFSPPFWYSRRAGESNPAVRTHGQQFLGPLPRTNGLRPPNGRARHGPIRLGFLGHADRALLFRPPLPVGVSIEGRSSSRHCALLSNSVMLSAPQCLQPVWTFLGLAQRQRCPCWAPSPLWHFRSSSIPWWVIVCAIAIKILVPRFQAVSL
jgi:hypothetical protein